MARILIVDDEPAVRLTLEASLRRLGHEPRTASGGAEALKALSSGDVDLVLCDYRLDGLSGQDVLTSARAEGWNGPFVVITAHGSIEHAVEMMRAGATDYLPKPVTPDTLEIVLRRSLTQGRLARENESFRNELGRVRAEKASVGQSAAIQKVLETIAVVAPTRATVLVSGESGVGKELVALAVHQASPRSAGPYVALNCAALPDGLVESALFGHEKGAFTGATARTAGAFERASGGTLLLDEITEMKLELQAKLLRALQEQTFERVGGHASVKVDTRVVATTNRDVEAEVRAGRFRADLFYRLNVVAIRVPPLRERMEDVAVMAPVLARRAAERHGLPPPPITPEFVASLREREWPGNVRELANAIERAVILSNGQPLRLFEADRTPSPSAAFVATTSSLPAFVNAGGPSPASTPRPGTPPASPAGAELPLNLEVLEQQAIVRALEASRGNRTQAARLLGISDRTLRKKLNGPSEPSESTDPANAGETPDTST